MYASLRYAPIEPDQSYKPFVDEVEETGSDLSKAHEGLRFLATHSSPEARARFEAAMLAIEDVAADVAAMRAEARHYGQDD
jgi:hypothetical protein